MSRTNCSKCARSLFEPRSDPVAGIASGRVGAGFRRGARGTGGSGARLPPRARAAAKDAASGMRGLTPGGAGGAAKDSADACSSDVNSGSGRCSSCTPSSVL